MVYIMLKKIILYQSLWIIFKEFILIDILTDLLTYNY